MIITQTMTALIIQEDIDPHKTTTDMMTDVIITEEIGVEVETEIENGNEKVVALEALTHRQIDTMTTITTTIIIIIIIIMISGTITMKEIKNATDLTIRGIGEKKYPIILL
jgi:hypothetical protein